MNMSIHSYILLLFQTIVQVSHIYGLHCSMMIHALCGTNYTLILDMTLYLRPMAHKAC